MSSDNLDNNNQQYNQNLIVEDINSFTEYQNDNQNEEEANVQNDENIPFSNDPNSLTDGKNSNYQAPQLNQQQSNNQNQEGVNVQNDENIPFSNDPLVNPDINNNELQNSTQPLNNDPNEHYYRRCCLYFCGICLGTIIGLALIIFGFGYLLALGLSDFNKGQTNE